VGTLTPKCLILRIETGGRVTKDFNRLIASLAKFQADHKRASLPHNPDPIEATAHRLLSARAKTIFAARIQTARIKTLTRRIMNIS
jgi:hypothetical protein